jgi:hypothetical protein
MKNLEVQAQNNVNITGKLISTTFGEGTMSDGRFYERANMVIRVTQTVDNNEETSEIPVSIFAAKYTKANKPNPGFENLQHLKEMKTAENVGIDEADVVRVRGANIRENNFVSRNGQLINGWQINASFVNKGNGASDIASVAVEIYILNMREEVNREDEETGRLIIKGGIVQYGGALDVLDFIVEDPDKVDYLRRNWEANQTVKANVRIRVKTVEDKKPAATSSWGEELPEETTRTVRELVITGGSDECYEEDLAYDPDEIRKAFNVRKAKLEQMQIDAKNSGAKKPVAETKSGGKYDWE